MMATRRSGVRRLYALLLGALTPILLVGGSWLALLDATLCISSGLFAAGALCLVVALRWMTLRAPRSEDAT